MRKWLDNLRDAVYCAEDLLDTVLAKAATQKEESSSWWSPSFFINRDRNHMVEKMEGVVRRIEDLGKQKDFLGLEKIPTGGSSWRTPSSSLVRGNVYGREDDKKALVKMLKDNTEHHLSVMDIVGIGGVDKTTLAQWLYNNQEEFMKGFDLKAWVCISEKFEVVETTRNVIKQIHGSTCSLDDFDLLQNALKKELSNKKFFIVLDDVWSDDGDKWSNFMTPFQQNGNKGSIILLTTRKENVAFAVQNCRPYFLRKLSEDYCWSVFAKNASFPESNGRAALEEIGRKIVKKCDGLLLAAETLGRLLHTKHDVEEWNKILMSHIPALLISYFHLSPHLKRCFVYCALFPKDYPFKKDELILLWMAEHLLPPPKRGKSLEEVGCECFDKLTSRLFFTKTKGFDHFFGMHDLLHDLAIFLAGDFYCNSEELDKEEEIKIQTRHLCVDLRHCSSKLYNSISKVESLRTLLLFANFSSPNCNIEAATCEILSKCKYLKVLSSDKLDVLCNLQTLKLRRCFELTTLPSGLHNLVNLPHLDIRGTSLEEMPGKMSKLNQLHVLGSFIVGKHEDNGIQELAGLNGLKELKIEGYKGTIFPDWLGNCSYVNMIRVSLKSCKNCCMLPSLGQLPSLKSLSIEGLYQLRRIGEAFYKNEGDHHSSHIAPFLSLDTLLFDNMEEMLNQVFFRIVSSLSDVSKVCKLDINEHSEAMFLDGDTLTISGRESVMESALKAMMSINHLREGLAAPNLTHLNVSRCSKLEALPRHMNSLLPSLHSLDICACPNICMSPEGGLPPNLKELTAGGCEKQVKDLSWMANLDALTHLRIYGLGCENIKSYPEVGSLPHLPSLTTLKIWWFNNLETLECNELLRLTSLQQLHIEYCWNLENMAGEKLPPSLSLLQIKLRYFEDQAAIVLRALQFCNGS
nr:putative disease resistance RPP13-like protein 1 [Arachis hypogaea]